VVKKYRYCVKESEIENEVKLLSIANHENIVQLYGTTTDGENRTVMLMEYADCGSLYDALHKRKQKLTHGIKMKWMFQCAKVGFKSLYLTFD